MQDDKLFNYTKIFLESFPFWIIVLLATAIFLYFKPHYFEKILRNFSRVKIGYFEIEIAKLKEEISNTKKNVSLLENEVERERSRFEDLLEGFDAHAPVEQLGGIRRTLKAMASSIQDIEPVRAGLRKGASPEQLYAAAEIARTRRDPALFDELVSCIERIARHPLLDGVRLYTVWTLTSALHQTIVADIKHSKNKTLSEEQLKRADEALSRLIINPRVLLDRPDAPSKGVRGPAKWAREWIEKGLAESA